jgi:hypothetical protein
MEAGKVPLVETPVPRGIGRTERREGEGLVVDEGGTASPYVFWNHAPGPLNRHALGDFPKSHFSVVRQAHEESLVSRLHEALDSGRMRANTRLGVRPDGDNVTFVVPGEQGAVCHYDERVRLHPSKVHDCRECPHRDIPHADSSIIAGGDDALAVECPSDRDDVARMAFKRRERLSLLGEDPDFSIAARCRDAAPRGIETRHFDVVVVAAQDGGELHGRQFPDTSRMVASGRDERRAIGRKVALVGEMIMEAKTDGLAVRRIPEEYAVIVSSRCYVDSSECGDSADGRRMADHARTLSIWRE